MENVNDTYFDGYYKDIWRNMIPEQLTVKEVEFMINQFQLQQGSAVLDLMCGYGRHAIALGEKGIDVTAVDNLSTYIQELSITSADRGLPVTAIKADILTYEPTSLFDLVICMGNSINFFDEQDTRRIFSKISKHLKPGGRLLIHSWSITEIAVRTFIPVSTEIVGGIQMETTTQFLFQPTRVEAETRMTASNGTTEVKKGIDFVFSISEYERMLADSNLFLINMYSIPGKKKFAIGEPRIYIDIQKAV